MPIDYAQAKALTTTGEKSRYSDRETMLYALGIGLGNDPLNLDELPFVYENGLKVVPTQATVIASGFSLIGQTGINYAMVVHGEQRLTIHKPLPGAASLSSDSRIVEIVDKGPGKGAVVITETVVSDAASGEALCTLTSSIFARADGGFGGPSSGGPEPHPVPDRAPDMELDFTTRPDQALLYRLSGDRNPLHSDPAFAKMVGFDRPILHGLCTYGITCRAVMQAYCAMDPTKIAAHDVRFSSPVYPGETISVQLWRDGDVVSFEARVKARDVVVIRNGRSQIAG